MSTTSPWKIAVEDDGRSGTVTYFEGDESVSFYREFLGGHSVACLSTTTQADWDLAHSWACGRQREIFERVAISLIGSVYAQGCRAEIDEATGTITFKKRRWLFF